MKRALLAVVVSIVAAVAALEAEPVAVRHAEGLVHGFLELRTLDGVTIADGDLIQVPHGRTLTTRLTFHFKDGSLHDETAVFSQRKDFHLVSDHLVQKGPSFPRPLDMAIDVEAGTVKVRYADNGKEKEESERLAIPPDVSNGLIPVLLKNVRADAPPASVSLIVATPKPRVVTLKLSTAGEDRFRTGGEERSARHFVLKVGIGGLSGKLAPLVGKQPPDSHVWILAGEAPAFIRSEQQLYYGGPVWRIELTAPAWRERVPAR